MNEWISVNDKMPPKYEWVLISFIDQFQTALRFVPSVGIYREDHWATKESDAGIDYVKTHNFEKDCPVKVTHWMPLPESPK